MTEIGMALDCAHPSELAEFWKLALGYVDEPPPAPYSTREEWIAQFAPADDDQDDGAWLCDPDGQGPALFLQQVREPKLGKNRMHLDVYSPGSSRANRDWPAALAHAARLERAGGSTLRVDDGHHVVMADPEGNEFCLC